jgi:site-specific DNA-methyltransferase (adenine-specific)
MQEMFNKIFNEDCLNTMSRMSDKSVNLIVADFPYFEVKGEFDFVWKSFDEFLEWVEVCAKEFKRILSDNGSLYVYGHAKKIAYKQIIFDKYFNIENHLVWNKVDSQVRRGISEFRSYAPVKEHILFYSNEVGMTGLEAIMEEYIKPRNPFSLYLRGEFKKAKVTNMEISKLFPSASGGLTGCVSNWLNGDSVITKEQYFKIRKYLNYEYLKKEYEDLKKEYEDLRRPFNNTKYVDVLDFIQETTETRKYNHPTQKPPKLSRALVETSTNKDSLIYIPFGGSGVEAEQCEILGLTYIVSEIEKKYCDIIEDRIKNAKGEVGLFDTKLQRSLF